MLAFAGDYGFDTVLVDTCQKDGTTLLDWMSLSAIHGFCAACRRDGIRVALAGSLGLRELEVLLEAKPDWFAVRGAVCRGGREGTIDPAKVRALARLLAGETPASTRGS